MLFYFEKVKRFVDVDLPLPVRGTRDSAGYDLAAAEDIVIPSYVKMIKALYGEDMKNYYNPIVDLAGVAEKTKFYGFKPTLVPTGVKCHMPEGYYLELSVRSSTPLKYWLLLANGVGIIDRDYYGNESNDGEIYLQMINLSPWDIQIHKGDKIGQGIIKTYCITDDDFAEATRKGGFGSTSGEEASAPVRGQRAKCNLIEDGLIDTDVVNEILQPIAMNNAINLTDLATSYEDIRKQLADSLDKEFRSSLRGGC